MTRDVPSACGGHDCAAAANGAVAAKAITISRYSIRPPHDLRATRNPRQPAFAIVLYGAHLSFTLFPELSLTLRL
jgi:hypothetical protein